MQKIPPRSFLLCEELWGSQFRPETCLLPLENHHPPWPGLGSSRGAAGGPGAAPCLWARARWDVVSPEIARSCGAPSERCDFPSSAWPRAPSLSWDFPLKLAALPCAACPVSVCLTAVWGDGGPEAQLEKKKHKIKALDLENSLLIFSFMGEKNDHCRRQPPSSLISDSHRGARCVLPPAPTCPQHPGGEFTPHLLTGLMGKIFNGMEILRNLLLTCRNRVGTGK